MHKRNKLLLALSQTYGLRIYEIDFMRDFVWTTVFSFTSNLRI